MLALYLAWSPWARMYGSLRATLAMQAGPCPDLRGLHWLARLREDSS